MSWNAGSGPGASRSAATGASPATSTTRSSRCGAPTTTEDAGEVYGFSLVYSGNFLAEAEVDALEATRVRLGISPRRSRGRLEPGDAFVTPEAVLVYSDAGLGAMSDAYHGLYRDRLARGAWRDAPRPVLINNWEATYFGFDETKLSRSRRPPATSASSCSSSTTAGSAGATPTIVARRLVRRPAQAAERSRRPGGRGRGLGLTFGLWIEPEMVSERSELFAAHPDWAVGVPGRPRTESRQQLVLDMSRPEVVDHLFDVLSEVLSSAPDLVRQVGHEPEHHGAVQRRACRPTGRASSSTATSWASTTSTPG